MKKGFAFQPEKLIIGILLNPDLETIQNIKKNLVTLFGETDLEIGPIPFIHTHYYLKEMGDPIDKYLFSFDTLISPEKLPEIKRNTCDLEKNCFSRDGKRFVNIDPGILSAAKLILATTKDYSHRIPLSNGIYGEIELQYEHKKWMFLPWTYPDFKTMEYLTFFNDVRNKYLQQLKTGKN